jgi:hypothetical protein
LRDEERYHRPARRHDVAVAGRAKHGFILALHAGLGHHELFHHGLGNAHCIDGVNRLVSAEHHHTLDTVGDRGGHHVLCAEHVGPYRFHGIKLAGRDLLERRGMEHEIDALHGAVHAVVIAYVADVKLQLVVTHGDAHFFLLFFVAAEDADFPDVRGKKPLQDRVPERAGASGDHQDFVFEHCIGVVI